MSADVRFQGQWGGKTRARGIGLGRLEGGGFSGWVGSGETPNTEVTWIPSPMARRLTSAGLCHIESGGPQAANNNFVAWNLLVIICFLRLGARFLTG